MSGMSFFVNKIGFRSMAIARRPVVLSYSLNLRLIRYQGFADERFDKPGFKLTFTKFSDY